jgi:hypothetical protein
LVAERSTDGSFGELQIVANVMVVAPTAHEILAHACVTKGGECFQKIVKYDDVTVDEGNDIMPTDLFDLCESIAD